MKLEYTNIAIECTDLCNMRCIMCNQRYSPGSMHGDSFKNEFLSIENFLKLISDLNHSSLEIGCINPCWDGESTMHPDFNIFMKILFEQNKSKSFFKRFNFNTNGLNFNKDLSEIFLDYAKYIKEKNLQEYMINITFSLDAIKRSTFKKVKGISGVHLDTILDNIDYLIRKRTLMELIMPNLTFQFIIVKQNEREAKKFLAYWQNYLSSLGVKNSVVTEISYSRDSDLIFFKTEDRPDWADYATMAIRRKNIVLKKLGIVKNNGKGAKENDGLSTINRQRRPCFQLWNMCVISRAGFVTPCCKDIFFELSLGNINEENIEEMWLGDKLKELRLNQIKGEFNKFKVCSQCLQPPGGYLPDDEIAQYLKLINEDNLLETFLNNTIQK